MVKCYDYAYIREKLPLDLIGTQIYNGEIKMNLSQLISKIPTCINFVNIYL